MIVSSAQHGYRMEIAVSRTGTEPVVTAVKRKRFTIIPRKLAAWKGTLRDR